MTTSKKSKLLIYIEKKDAGGLALFRVTGVSYEHTSTVVSLWCLLRQVFDLLRDKRHSPVGVCWCLHKKRHRDTNTPSPLGVVSGVSVSGILIFLTIIEGNEDE
jgi:hypothetical protein